MGKTLSYHLNYGSSNKYIVAPSGSCTSFPLIKYHSLKRFSQSTLQLTGYGNKMNGKSPFNSWCSKICISCKYIEHNTLLLGKPNEQSKFLNGNARLCILSTKLDLPIYICIRLVIIIFCKCGEFIQIILETR